MLFTDHTARQCVSCLAFPVRTIESYKVDSLSIAIEAKGDIIRLHVPRGSLGRSAVVCVEGTPTARGRPASK
jgi:hypothetical protein